MSAAAPSGAPAAAVAAAPRRRPFNFNAGPAALPESVLLEAQASMLDFGGSGMGLMELSHRSAHFEKVIAEAEADCRELLNIPSSYRVLFMQGGGSTQFSAVPLNLCASPATPSLYLVTGAWSQAAQQEGGRFSSPIVLQSPAVSGAPKGSFTTLPSQHDLAEFVRTKGTGASFVYACANETVHGVEWPTNALEQLFDAESSSSAPSAAAGSALPSAAGPVLVADMSSSFMSRPVDVSRYGLIYAGAQKNVGPAGLTLVIVRDSLISKAPLQTVPLMLQYKLHADKGSMHNTPPCWAIYVTGLVFKWLKAQGGLAGIAEKNEENARTLYEAIDGSEGFYRAFVSGSARSRMNVVFTVSKAGSPLERDDALNAKLVEQAEAQGLVGLAGHRSVGGLRASLYNAVTLEAVQALVKFLRDFQAAHSRT